MAIAYDATAHPRIAADNVDTENGCSVKLDAHFFGHCRGLARCLHSLRCRRHLFSDDNEAPCNRLAVSDCRELWYNGIRYHSLSHRPPYPVDLEKGVPEEDEEGPDMLIEDDAGVVGRILRER